MNLALRGIEANLGPHNEDTFRRDLHPDLRADFVLANPPFNMSDWSRDPDDPRWRHGVPPAGNANYAWVQHIVHHLSPQGIAGLVRANGSMSSKQSGEGEIRRSLVEDDLVDCMVALPPQLFYGNPGVSLVPRPRQVRRADPRRARATRPPRRDPVRRRPQARLDGLADAPGADRRGAGADRRRLPRLARRAGRRRVRDVPGFCRGAALEEIREHGHVLTPGRSTCQRGTRERGKTRS